MAATIVPPEGTTELGIDIIRVERIADALRRFGARFPRRILTEAENAYVRDRPENLAGRWAAKEAVSKVLGLGVRGVGWREIEIVRLPTGQPTVRLHDRALARAGQLGMERIAVSISHEREYAVAIAFGIRTTGGAFVFPPDIEARLDVQEQRILDRIDRLRELERTRRGLEAVAATDGRGGAAAARAADPAASSPRAADPAAAGADRSDPAPRDAAARRP